MRPMNQTVACKGGCGGRMCVESDRCRGCHLKLEGRPQTPEFAYAAELGITARQVKQLGGIERLQRMDPEARRLLCGPHFYGKSRVVARGGLAARGMRRGQTGRG